MRSDIIGFRQDLLIKYDLDIIDALLLSYVQRACISHKMIKICDENNQAYVWLQHTKVLEDLPILGVKEGFLKKRISKLVEVGMLKSIIKRDEIRGSRAYYTTTELCEELSLTNDDQGYSGDCGHCDQGYSHNPDTTRPRSQPYPSDNKLDISDNKLNSDIDNSISINTNTTPKEEYSVNDFVNDYNSICKSLPKCRTLTDKRKKKVKYLLNKFTKEQILQVFNKLEASDFCKGINNRGWKADFGFILSEDKFVSALEGKYDNKGMQVSMQKDDVFSEYGKVHTGKKVGALVNEQF